jgi:hypothetical protein
MSSLTTFAARSLALLSVVWLAAGCIDVNPADGVYSCTATVDCPANYDCDLSTHSCLKHGHTSPAPHSPDLGELDMSVDDGGSALACHDGVKDGNESDVDCGGDCAPCATGATCGSAADCESQLCNSATHQCVGSQCEDGLKDSGETDIDCGGGTCPGCGQGQACAGNSDCTSDICSATDHTCAGSLCSDGVKDGQETDVDCGGPTCSRCLGGKICDVDGDCASGACNVTTHTCAASACENGVKDSGETDVDCGGTTCPQCALTKACLAGTDCASHYCNATTFICVASQCLDGTHNGTETDIDCGGSCGANCKVGATCKTSGDCASGSCGSNNTCVSTQCEDGVKDGVETDKDCGGGTCPGCPLSDGCIDGNRDCLSKFCNASSKTCVGTQCLDGAVDGSETDVDCGGPTCPKCSANQRCKSGSDCTSSYCNKDSLTCVASQCSDGFKDNGETDVDCGGGATTGCAACGLGKGCGSADANCASGSCNFVSSLCVASACADGRVDNVETDVDCGGGSCAACPAGKICKLNGDCGSSACDYGPSPHQCVTDACVDHHLDGNETDVDCGGGSCAQCGLNKTCAASSDCASGYCDPASHKCECGGVGQACCAGGQCTQASGNLCGGAVSCASNNICVQGSPVVCPPAVNQCQVAGTCSASTGQCSAPILESGGSCNSGDQCIVNTTCANGQCTNGTHVADRCTNSVAETCNNNTWTTKATCAYGCGGAGVCNGPTVPAVTATVNGSDVSVSWSAPAAGLTCKLLRSDNGASYQPPLSLITPCPASAAQPCSAYDPALLRGSYSYELSCSDGTVTGVSAASSAVSPALEICAGDWSTALEVHTAAPDNLHDKLERKMSVSASLLSTVGVAYSPPSTATNTNCAPGDHSCGTVFVTSHDNDKIMAFDRRAADADAVSNPAGPQPPSASQRTLTLSLKDAGVTKYQPVGVAVLGNEIIVAMTAAPGFVAAFPKTFATSTPSPNWYLRGKNTASVVMPNKISNPISVAVDSGTGTGSGFIFVGNAQATGSTSYTITGYRRDDIASNINSTDFVNDTVAPFMTITTTFPPYSLAVDSLNHVLYVTDPSSGRVVLYPSNGTGAVAATGALQGPQMTTPTGLAFLPATSGGTLFVVDNSNGAITSFPGGSTGTITPVINFTVANLKANAAGLVICN